MQILQTCVDAYIRKVYDFCNEPDKKFALTFHNVTGKIKQLLNETRVKSHVSHLDAVTSIEDYDRRFIRSRVTKDVDEGTKAELMKVNRNF